MGVGGRVLAGAGVGLDLGQAYRHAVDRQGAAEQRAGRWSFVLPEPARTTRVGIMGLGELGRHAAGVLLGQGFTVRGWSRSPRDLPGGTAFAGADGLQPFLADTNILVCLLPLTAATRGILDAGLLAGLPQGARLLNVGRGGHLVEADLLAALERVTQGFPRTSPFEELLTSSVLLAACENDGALLARLCHWFRERAPGHVADLAAATVSNVTIS